MRGIDSAIACAEAIDDNDVQRLPSAPRLLLERAFGADLSAVRLDTGRDADRLARALGADAFTFGATIYFRRGAYQPGTVRGLWLIAHEAAHVLQQAAGAASSTSAAECERQADRAADVALAGGTWHEPVGPGRARRAGPAPLIQRHSSYEHRLLGDSPTSDLVAISTGAPNRRAVLDNQIQLMALWKDHPDQVTPEQVQVLCPWIKTLRIGLDQELATFGELNALPDYLSDAVAFDTLGSDILLPVLQVIRQENYNQLTLLATGSNPLVRFARSAAAPWQLSMVNSIVETTALDTLTLGLGPDGQNHYQGLLARNACHFAPFSWYRWQASYLIARDLAATSYVSHDPELARRALVYGGYADHFLEDSFAAGHLVNKTLVMQWCIEWAASQTLIPVADWDLIKYMTTTAQPSLMGSWLYDPGFQGPSNDPQTAQEAATLADRIIASSVLADGPRGQFASYQNYLTFLTSAAAQLASAMLHDYYNDHSLWVASSAQRTPYEIWGDDTLLTGRNGADGVRATSEAAQLAAQSLTELINTGQTSITTQQVRDRIPTQAGSSSTSLTDLRTWTTSQRDFCVQQFQGLGLRLKELLTEFGSPRLGISSQDQEFASIWSVSLPDSGYHQVDNLLAGGRLFTGSDGYVYEIDPVTGKVVHELHLTTIIGGDVTHLATDGTFLFAGVHGYLYAVRLADWSEPAWYKGLGATGSLGRVSVLYQGGRLYAGSDGYVYELRPADGSILHELPLTTYFGSAETRISADGNYLYAGVHGYAYGIRLSDWSSAAWNTPVGGTGQFELVTVLAADGSLYAGSNGSVYELRPSDGHERHSKRLSDAGAGAEVRIATNGAYLFAGTHGYAYGVALDNWSRAAWSSYVGSVTHGPVSVLSQGGVYGRLYAASSGYVSELDPVSGSTLHVLPLTYLFGVGDYDTTIIADGESLYAGVHGYSSKLLAQNIPPPSGTVLHASHGPQGWSRFVRDFDGAPRASSGFATDTPFGITEAFLVGTDGTLYYDHLDKDGRWYGWVPNVDNAPKAKAMFGTGSVTSTTEMFLIGIDGTLFRNYLDRSGRWHGWTPNFDGAPKVTAVFGLNGASGNTEIFAIGTDGTLYHDFVDPRGNWHGWTPNYDGAPKVSAVFGALGVSGNTEVFAIGTDGTLYHDYLDPAGHWHGWTPNFDGAPKATTGFAAIEATFNTEVFSSVQVTPSTTTTWTGAAAGTAGRRTSTAHPNCGPSPDRYSSPADRQLPTSSRLAWTAPCTPAPSTAPDTGTAGPLASPEALPRSPGRSSAWPGRQEATSYS